MSQPFAFPPPPPPPQNRKDSQSFAQYPSANSIGRGRGGSRGNSLRGSSLPRGLSSRGRGRAHGGHHLRGGPLGAESQITARYTSHDPGQQYRSYGQRNEHHSALHGAGLNPKRNHTAAFGNYGAPNVRPKAPPAVPSFNADLEALLSSQPTTGKAHKNLSAKKSNLLGLTPSTQEPEDQSDSDDGDDEARMAKAVSNDGYTFSHKGQTMSLRTPEEITAWIAERRKRYPTKVKVEAARQEAEEKKRQREEQKREREAAAKVKAEERKEQRREHEKQRLKQGLLAHAMARSKAEIAKKNAQESKRAASGAEILSRRVERATKQLRKAEEALRKAQARFQAERGPPIPLNSSTEILDQSPQFGSQTDSEPIRRSGSPESLQQNSNEPLVSTDDSAESDEDDTSTSGSSESELGSESDSAPEAFSTHRTGPDRESPAKPKHTNPNGRRLCHNIVKFGNCRYGKKCRYSHEIPRKEDKSRTNQVGSSTKRKSLYQIMVEQEQEAQQKAALAAIISLGQRGLLVDVEEKSGPEDKSS